MENDTSPEAGSRRRGRAWSVAVLIWLAVCCTSAVVVLAEIQVSGLGGLSTPRGSRELAAFGQRALLYPGLLLPALVLLRPRWSIVICALVLLATIILLVLAVPRSRFLEAYLPFWGGAVVPVVLASMATWLAYRRGDWRPNRAAANEAA